jgi:hypothetical protein
MLKRIATSNRAIEALGLFCVLTIAGVLTWAVALALSESRDVDALQSPVMMDDLQVNQLATFMNNGYWSLESVVIGQQFGGAATGRDSSFASYSISGGCVGDGCNDNAEWHDAITASSQGAGPQVLWYVTDGPSKQQGIGAAEKVSKHNSTNNDHGADFNIYVQNTTPNGGGFGRGFTVDANEHIEYASQAVNPTSCGTGPSMLGGDAFAFGSTGTGATACTIPWAIPYDSIAPGCVVTCSNGCTMTWVESTTGLAITFGASGQWNLRYTCAGGV